MTNITNLPKEIFQNIVKNLESQDLYLCQNVCRAWYRPSHLQFLNNVSLYGADNIEEFIFAIDTNPDPAYLDAVKSICFYNSDYHEKYDGGYYNKFYDQDMFYRLFFRFQNLAKVEFGGGYGLISKFNYDLCQRFLQSCKKLDTFAVHYPGNDDDDINKEIAQANNYYGWLGYVRILLTHMDARQLSYLDRDGDYDPIYYIVQIPRLRHVENASRCFTNFYQWLIVLEKCPDCRYITIESDDRIDLAESRLIKKEKRKMLLERLSKVRELEVLGTFEKAVAFASKYLTGLETFATSGTLIESWDDLQIQRYCNSLWDLASTTKITSDVLLKELTHTFLSANLSTITSKVFYDIESSSSVNSLRLFIKADHYFGGNSTDLWVHSSKPTNRCEIDISFDKDTTVNTIEATLSAVQLYNVTSFELEMASRDQRELTTIDTYDKILMKLPTLRRLILDIPSSFQSGGETDIEYCLDLLKCLTIRANGDVNLKQLFNRFHQVIPNIKHLSIFYYSGIWNPITGEFDLDLSNYTLEQLTVDLSPVKNKSLKYLAPQIPPENHFVDLSVIVDGKKQMYRVPLYVSPAMKVEDDDLLGFKCGIDYYQLNITIKNLQCLQLFIDYNDYSLEINADYKNTTRDPYYSCDDNDSKTFEIVFGDSE